MKNNKCAPAAYAAVNDLGKRIGEGHPRAKFTDVEIDRMLELREAGMSWSKLAREMQCSKRHARDVCAGLRRGQYAARWVRLSAKPPVQSRP